MIPVKESVWSVGALQSQVTSSVGSLCFLVQKWDGGSLLSISWKCFGKDWHWQSVNKAYWNIFTKSKGFCQRKVPKQSLRLYNLVFWLDSNSKRGL